MTGLETIDETQIARLVSAFYARVRDDALIGPVFENAVLRWDDHLAILANFWSSVMLTSGHYKGNPMAAHMKHRAKITPAMFDRWLVLWAQVTAEMLPPPIAAALQAKAARIADSLRQALYFRIPARSSVPPPLQI